MPSQNQNVQDLIIVGGGIIGAGAFRDACLRKLDVLLFEKSDFASGTSSRSSKLIHGGLRYLEMLDLHLVFEACQERNRLRQLAPYLVRPLPFLYPIYQSSVTAAKVRVGLLLYDLLSSFRNIAPHTFVSLQKVADAFPDLTLQGLKAAARYFDAFEDDARLTLETLKIEEVSVSPRAHNYAEVTSIKKEPEGSYQVNVYFSLTGEKRSYRARSLLLAAGPWAEEAAARAGIQRRLLRLSRGVHLVVERSRLPVPYAIALHAVDDRRFMFCIPWGNKSIIGTTDTEYLGSPDDVAATPEDMRYLLDTVNHYFPTVSLTPSDVLATFAGVRPLFYQEGVSTYRSSREHVLLEFSPGLFLLLGGKYTTFRRIAKECIDKVADHLEKHYHKASPPCQTARTPYIGGRKEELKAYPAQDALHRHLLSRYGKIGGAAYASFTARDRERLVPDSFICKKEILWAIEREKAKTLSDLLLRRTRLGILSKHRREAISLLASIAGEYWGWSEKKRQEEMARAQEELRRFYPSGDEIVQKKARLSPPSL